MSTNTPRPENPELLAAIIAHPDEDTPRLMYADWLQENGDPDRAEFIRLHIEWDRRPPNAPPDDDLKRKLIDALNVIEPPEQWGDRMRRWGHYVYERGFISGVDGDFGSEVTDVSNSACRSMPIRMLYSGAPELFQESEPEQFKRLSAVLRSMPPLTGLGVEWDYNYGIGLYWESYLRSSASSGLRVLDFNYSRGYDTCPFVAELTHLTNLLVLDLTVCCRFEGNCFELLASAPHLRSLIALRLAADDEYRGAMTTDDIARLVESPYLTNLRQLTLNNHEDLNDEAVERLLAWDRAGQLEVLEMSCRSITSAGVRAVARAPQLRKLRRLVLDGVALESEAITALLDSRHLRGLTELYLSPPPVSMTVDLMHQLKSRFPKYAQMTFDPPAVCVEDRIRGRYRLMTHPSMGGTYRGRGQAYGSRQEPPLFPEYAIL